MIIHSMFSHMNALSPQSTSAFAAHDKYLACAHAASALFVDNKPQLQASFLCGLLTSTYAAYGFSMFSPLARLLTVTYWATLSGESVTYLHELLDFVGEQIESLDDCHKGGNAGVGQIFSDWQEFDQEFAQKISRRIVSLEPSEDDGLWMLDPVLVRVLRNGNIDVLGNGNTDALVREFKRVQAEAQQHPLNLLSWRLQNAVKLPFDTLQETSLNVTSPAAMIAERLAGLIVLLLEHRNQNGMPLLKPTPVTVAQMFESLKSNETKKSFDVEIIERWLTDNTATLTETFLTHLCEHGLKLGLLFKNPVRISPRITRDGYGLTRIALEIARPFHDLISRAITLAR